MRRWIQVEIKVVFRTKSSYYFTEADMTEIVYYENVQGFEIMKLSLPEAEA